MTEEGFGKRLTPSLGHALQKYSASQWPASPCSSSPHALPMPTASTTSNDSNTKCIEKIDMALKIEFKKINDSLKRAKARLQRIDVPLETLHKLIERCASDSDGTITWRRKPRIAPPSEKQ